MTPMVRAVGVSKSYGATKVLADLNLEVPRGESLGVTGVNGAGRSTLMRVLATLVRPSSGSLQIDGLDCARDLLQARQRIAYAGDDRLDANGLTALEYVTLLHASRRVAAAGEPAGGPARGLERAGVPGASPVGALSTGLRQRLALSAALTMKTALLILDDPFRGLDEHGRSLFQRWIVEARESGTTLILTSTDERDLTAICHRIVRLDGGRVAQARVARAAASST